MRHQQLRVGATVVYIDRRGRQRTGRIIAPDPDRPLAVSVADWAGRRCVVVCDQETACEHLISVAAVVSVIC